MIPIQTIHRYGITLRPVEVSDAEFILKLRTDERLGQFLSVTSPDLEQQQEWIRGYKEREAIGKEYYYIAEKDGAAYGTIRTYKIGEDWFEGGSWLFSPDAPVGMSILADIINREFAFEVLDKSVNCFEVRRLNQAVVKYQRGYRPIQVAEDELNYYFILTRRQFAKYKQRYLKLLGFQA
ncbi:GNAT family N-acetyltransferase [uncultured Rikenella sp.]|uniref:GNAT family N-acetyltransferase n=1 Tax=uncultured Rikenella sp. TaxID=368003 RepID=UPI002624F757|nr:GNAT family N-acetyltransferase [uncultured Rikenella sp.]